MPAPPPPAGSSGAAMHGTSGQTQASAAAASATHFRQGPFPEPNASGSASEFEFLRELLAFERNYAAGNKLTFSQTIGRPPSVMPAFEEADETAFELSVSHALDFYLQHHIAVEFEFDYPAATRLHFLLHELPELPNHFGREPAVTFRILYEEFHPNHSASLEKETLEWLNAFPLLNADRLRYAFAPVLYPPEGPYPLYLLLDALADRFRTIREISDYEFCLLETGYLFSDEGAGDGQTGEGYSEGLLKYTVTGRTGKQKNWSGPFRFHYHYENGTWSLVYLIFPGIRFPEYQPDVE